MAQETIDLDDLSEVIGTIYDCAIDAQYWPKAIERIANLVNGAHGVIMMIDTIANNASFYVDWNVDATAMQKYREEYHAGNPLQPAFARFEQDEPYNISTAIDVNVWLKSRVYREFGAPRGWLDNLGVSILKTPSRMASLSIVCLAEAGWAGPRELNILGLLSPHVRRAVSISDLIQMRTLAIATFESTLDGLSVPVILVDQFGRVVHANAAARSLLADGGAVTTEHGKLRAANPAASILLEAAIAQTAQPEWRMGKIGIDIALPYRDGGPGSAHVLPLGIGAVRGGLEERATAAIFLAPTREPFRPPLEAWAAAFGFTPTELKVLGLLIAGRDVAEIAHDLGVAETTVRTHVTNLMSKAGASRQVELIQIAQRMAPAVRSRGE